MEVGPPRGPDRLTVAGGRADGRGERDGGGAPRRGLHIALTRELFVGADHGAPGHTELGGERAAGWKDRPGREPSRADGVAECGLNAVAAPRSEIDVQTQVHGWSNLISVFWTFRLDQSVGNFAVMELTLEDRARQQAGILRAAHRPGDPLVLPNVWDVAGARRVAAAGFPVIATSSAAVAESLGYPGHEGMPAEVAFGVIRRLAEAVDLPITADVEAGYGLSADELAARLMKCGAAGCNLEDTDHRNNRRVAVDRQCERIASVVEAARSRGFALVVNARIDTWFHAVDDPRSAAEDALQRARAYLAAGAACVFPIGRLDHELIAALVREIPGPVNVLHAPGDDAGPGALAGLGVARISTGPFLWRRALGHLEQDLGALHPRPDAEGAGRRQARAAAELP
jgi:2-methylisocitrate lyase-like PEP mutase family enzyme